MRATTPTTPGMNNSTSRRLTMPCRACRHPSALPWRCGTSMVCPCRRSPTTSAEACTRPRPSSSGPGPRFVASIRRRRAMENDPLAALRLPVVPVQPRPEFAANLLRRIRRDQAPAVGKGATIRYFVADLEAAVAFYCDELGFDEELRPSPIFAMLYHGDLRLLLSVPGSAHALPDGTLPDPGGWNRLVLQVHDIDAAVERLRSRRVRFRHETVTGVGVRHALLDDPSGNPVELFQPLAAYHEREERNSE